MVRYCTVEFRVEGELEDLYISEKWLQQLCLIRIGFSRTLSVVRCRYPQHLCLRVPSLALSSLSPGEAGIVAMAVDTLGLGAGHLFRFLNTSVDLLRIGSLCSRANQIEGRSAGERMTPEIDNQ